MLEFCSSKIDLFVEKVGQKKRYLRENLLGSFIKEKVLKIAVFLGLPKNIQKMDTKSRLNNEKFPKKKSPSSALI